MVSLSLDTKSIFLTLLERSFSVFLRPMWYTPDPALVRPETTGLCLSLSPGMAQQLPCQAIGDAEEIGEFRLILERTSFLAVAEGGLRRRGEGARLGSLAFRITV